VKILAVSDEVVEFLYGPGLRQKFGDVDLVIGCGDLPFYYLEFIVTALDVPLYYVPGNHDRLQQYLSDGRIIHRAEGCEALDTRAARVAVRPAASSAARRPPLLLAGLGGSMRYNNDGVHQYTEGEMLSRVIALAPRLVLNRLRHGRFLDILVTHAPPRRIHDESDLAHTGFQAFRTFMDLFRPRLLLHGHSHVYRSDTITSTRYKHTQVLNVYPYRLIHWEAAA
jgi:calcineurin-like phosphoesterase family protein